MAMSTVVLSTILTMVMMLMTTMFMMISNVATTMMMMTMMMFRMPENLRQSATLNFRSPTLAKSERINLRCLTSGKDKIGCTRGTVERNVISERLDQDMK